MTFDVENNEADNFLSEVYLLGESLSEKLNVTGWSQINQVKILQISIFYCFVPLLVTYFYFIFLFTALLCSAQNFSVGF